MNSDLRQHAQTILQPDAGVDAFREASKALEAALEQSYDFSDWPEAECDTFFRTLLTQPAPGQHQLAHHCCHLVTSGVPHKTQSILDAIRQTLINLVSGLDSLSADAQQRVVLFAVTTRAFSRDWLVSDQVSTLHKKYFTRFQPADLALPYSVMFHPYEFGENQRDVMDAFLPEGHLVTQKDLSPCHAVLLAWLSGHAIFDGPVGLGDILTNADLSDADQAAAARSLVLRFGQGDNAICADLTDRLKLTGVEPASSRRANTAALTKLKDKRYHVLHAGLNRAKVAVPFLKSLQRKPKVGLCLSGQLRGYEVTLETWKRRLFPLIEPEVFVHSWSDIGRAGAQPHRQVLPFEGEAFAHAYREVAIALGYPETKQKYPTLFARLTEGGQVSEDHLRAVYETEHVVLEDDQDARFAAFTNQQKMHYKIHAADALAREAGDFDLLLRIRPDLGMRDVGFAWGDMLKAARSGPVLFAEKGYGVHYGGLLVGDQFALGAPDTMQHYADTWTTFEPLAKLGLAHCPKELTGHVSLAHTCWLAGVDIMRAPIRFTTLNEAKRLSAVECLAAIEQDTQGTREDLKLIAAARKDLQESAV